MQDNPPKNDRHAVAAIITSQYITREGCPVKVAPLLVQFILPKSYWAFLCEK